MLSRASLRRFGAFSIALGGLSIACFIGVAGCGRRVTGEAPRASTSSPAVVHVPTGLPAATDVALPRPTRPDLPDLATDWCLDGWRALDAGTCYLVPEGLDGAASPTLLVYLSGIVPPEPKSPQKENVQRVVASAARRAGVVAMLPRGRRGIGPAGAKDWWAWPTTARDYAAHASAMLAEWAAARGKLETALGHFDRVYLAGSSSGAYFITALVFAGAVDMNGYAAISGGSSSYARADAEVKKRPFYVGYASGDSTNGGPKSLGRLLETAGWPVRIAVHPGGHGAREVYLDEAFAFWAGGDE